jgi:hypothetical protein
MALLAATRDLKVTNPVLNTDMGAAWASATILFSRSSSSV